MKKVSRAFSIGIIGCGVMGQAIAVQTLRSTARGAVYTYDIAREKCRRFYASPRLIPTTLDTLVKKSSVIIIAVKPQDIHTVFAALGNRVGSRHVIVSIAAGITTAAIEKALGKETKVIRVMPNLPLIEGKAACAMSYGSCATTRDAARVEHIFRACGEVTTVKESHMDAVTAVSGSGPAYFFLFLRSLIRAAEQLGLPRHVASRLVYATAEGSVAMARRYDAGLDTLLQKVASRRGTTEAALAVFAQGGFEDLTIRAVRAAHSRARALAREKN